MIKNSGRHRLRAPGNLVDQKTIGNKGSVNLKRRVLRLLSVFSRINTEEVDSNVSFNTFGLATVAREPAMQSPAEAEFRKAQVLAWYMTQRTKMM